MKTVILIVLVLFLIAYVVRNGMLKVRRWKKWKSQKEQIRKLIESNPSPEGVLQLSSQVIEHYQENIPYDSELYKEVINELDYMHSYVRGVVTGINKAVYKVDHRSKLIDALEEACFGLEHELSIKYNKADEEKLNEWRELLKEINT